MGTATCLPVSLSLTRAACAAGGARLACWLGWRAGAKVKVLAQTNTVERRYSVWIGEGGRGKGQQGRGRRRSSRSSSSNSCRRAGLLETAVPTCCGLHAL